MQRGKMPTQNEVEEARTGAFLDKLRAILQKGEFKRQDHLVERLLEEGFTSTDLVSALMHLSQVADGAPVVRPPREERQERPIREERRERPPERIQEHRREPVAAAVPAAPPVAAIRRPEPPRPPKIRETRERVETPVIHSPKHSRRTPENQTRLYVSVGTEMGIAAGDIVGAILGETGLPSKV